MRTIAIVGVGLIGGSFARAMRKAGFNGRILGVSSPTTVAKALRLKVIDEAPPLEESAAQADLVYLSQPIRQILDIFPRLNACVSPGALVTDAGSTKAAIVRAASEHLTRAPFLGGHPMAGKESRGVEEADADLFRDRTWVLTPGSPSELESPDAARLVDWIGQIGARVLVLPAEQHDQLVAFTSHLPQLASTALAATLSGRSDQKDLLQTAGPGLLDTTRLAASPYDVWSDILATNPDRILEALSDYIGRLEELRGALNESSTERQFTAAARFAAALRKPLPNEEQ